MNSVEPRMRRLVALAIALISTAAPHVASAQVDPEGPPPTVEPAPEAPTAPPPFDGEGADEQVPDPPNPEPESKRAPPAAD
jgi:hypothetical protein